MFVEESFRHVEFFMYLIAYCIMIINHKELFTLAAGEPEL